MNARRVIAAAAVLLALAALRCGDEGPPVAVDRDPPRLVSVAPADGATAVPVASVVRALFSEPVVLDSLAPPPLRVAGPGGEPMPGEVALDTTGSILTFTATDSLSAASDYRAVVAAGIADRAGNVLLDSTVVRFTTALDFYSIGRLFTANANTFDVSALDILTYEPVAGSPVALGARPLSLAAVPAWGEVFVLYAIGPGAGVLVLDGRSLAVLRDTGPVFPRDATDLAVSDAEELLFVASPAANALFVYDARTMGEARPPLVFPQAGANPVRLAVASRFGWLFAGLEGGAVLAAYDLETLAPIAGFPVPAVRRIHSIAVDETRARAWVGGSQRYAVVDLVNPGRTITFAWPTMRACLPPRCETRGWGLFLSPAFDRVYLLNRQEAVASVGLSSLEESTALDGSVNGYQAGFAQNPRTGAIMVVNAQSAAAGLVEVDPWELRQTTLLPIPVGGGGVVAVAVLP